MFKVSLTCTCRKGVTIKYGQRDVAQLGSALRLGRRGRTFESCHPDHLEKSSQKVGSFFIYRGVALTFTPRIVSSRPFRKELTKSGFFFYFYREVALTFTPRIVSSRPFRKELTISGFFFCFYRGIVPPLAPPSGGEHIFPY